MKPPNYKTPRFILKPYELKDETRFIEIALDPNSIEFMGGATGDVKIERKLFKTIFDIYENTESNRWFWIWGVYEEDKLVAHFELKETEDTVSGELEIIYMVHPNERKKGVMTEVLACIKKNQKEWDKQITATADPKNIGSISILEKWGIIKKELRIDDETDKRYYKFWLEQ